MPLTWLLLFGAATFVVVDIVAVAAGAGVPLDTDIARGTGFRGLPQAMFNFSQKLTSPSLLP